MTVCVCVYSRLTSLSTTFQSYHDVVWLRQGAQYAHFYSAASLKYHVPDTWHDTTPSHIILTRSRPVLALSRKSKRQARMAFIILMILVCRGLGSNRDLPFPGADTLPTELPLPVATVTEGWDKDIIIGPGHVKTCLMPYANNKGADPRSLISTFVVRCLYIFRNFKTATFYVDCFLYWVDFMLFPIQYFILPRDEQQLTVKRILLRLFVLTIPRR